MKAKVNLKVEILDGEDKGYIFEERNRVIELEDNKHSIFSDEIIPHKISVKFVTPDQFRKKWMQVPEPCKKEGKKDENNS